MLDANNISARRVCYIIMRLSCLNYSNTIQTPHTLESGNVIRYSLQFCLKSAEESTWVWWVKVPLRYFLCRALKSFYIKNVEGRILQREPVSTCVLITESVDFFNELFYFERARESRAERSAARASAKRAQLNRTLARSYPIRQIDILLHFFFFIRICLQEYRG